MGGGGCLVGWVEWLGLNGPSVGSYWAWWAGWLDGWWSVWQRGVGVWLVGGRQVYEVVVRWVWVGGWYVVIFWLVGC